MPTHAEPIADLLRFAHAAARRARPWRRDEVFSAAQLATWEAVLDYRPDCGFPLRACVSRRVKLRLIDDLRHETRLHAVPFRQADPAIFEEILDPRAFDPAERAEMTDMVRLAVLRLPDLERNVVSLELGIGRDRPQSTREIALSLGISERTAQRLRRHAVESLRYLLPRSLLSA